MVMLLMAGGERVVNPLCGAPQYITGEFENIGDVEYTLYAFGMLLLSCAVGTGVRWPRSCWRVPQRGWFAASTRKGPYCGGPDAQQPPDARKRIRRNRTICVEVCKPTKAFFFR
jgi:hypothetical protein